MTRDAAVQQAREWEFRRFSDGRSAFEDKAVTLAAYALDRLAQELGELAKEMCRGCREGFPLAEPWPNETTTWHRSFEGDDVTKCESTPIQVRLAAIEQVRKEEP